MIAECIVCDWRGVPTYLGGLPSVVCPACKRPRLRSDEPWPISEAESARIAEIVARRQPLPEPALPIEDSDA